MRARSYYEARARDHRTRALLLAVLLIALGGAFLACLRHAHPHGAIGSAVLGVFTAFSAGHHAARAAAYDDRESIRRRPTPLKP